MLAEVAIRVTCRLYLLFMTPERAEPVSFGSVSQNGSKARSVKGCLARVFYSSLVTIETGASRGNLCWSKRSPCVHQNMPERRH